VTKKTNALHLPGLNGLRAIAAMGVLLSHLSMALDTFNLKQWLGVEANGHPTGLQLGKYGVIIFFALSGFLITYLLLLEKEKSGVQIKKFYVRRILRIWPLYYFYLGLAYLTYFSFRLGFPNVLPFYLFYTANIPFILRTPLPFVEHYWSLAVEEQFYLFWPWIVKNLKAKPFTIVACLIGLIVGVKLFLHFVLKSDFSQIVIDAFPFHCMMMGGAGAILYKSQNKTFLQIVDNRISQGLAWLALFAVAVNRFHVASVLDPEIIACVAVVIIAGQINRKNRLINLEFGVFDFLGKISYGLYIYHPLVIFLTAKLLAPLLMPSLPKYLLVYFSVTGLTVLIAYLSYTYFESYFLKLKEKFAVVKSAPTKEEAASLMPQKMNAFIGARE